MAVFVCYMYLQVDTSERASLKANAVFNHVELLYLKCEFRDFLTGGKFCTSFLGELNNLLNLHLNFQ